MQTNSRTLSHRPKPVVVTKAMLGMVLPVGTVLQVDTVVLQVVDAVVVLQADAEALQVVEAVQAVSIPSKSLNRRMPIKTTS